VTVFEAGMFRGQTERRVDGIRLREVAILRDVPLFRAARHINRFRWIENRLKRSMFRDQKAFFASRLFHPTFILRTALELRKERFDIVHITNFPQFVPIVRAMNPGTLIALHMHSDWLSCQFERKQVLKWAGQADLILGCSNYITHRVQVTLPELAARCHTVYNGVDVDAYQAVKRYSPPPGSPATILFTGRIAPVKGVHTLIEAFARVVPKYPNVRLKIIGKMAPAPPEDLMGLEGPLLREMSQYYAEDYRAVLKRLVTPTIRDKVEFVGLVPNRLLGGHYASADIMVAPSVWPEPFGMIIPEAMAAGTPVIATRGGGIPEIIEDGVNGLLVERGDVEDLGAAMLYLLRNPDRRRVMGEAARRRAEDFTWDKTVTSLLATLSSVLSRSSEKAMIAAERHVTTTE